MGPVRNEYYIEREWNPKTGVPKAKKLRKLGPDYVVDDLMQNGIKMK